MVTIISSLHQTINPNRKHYDLINAINEAIKRSPLTWKFNHVYGHQDDGKDRSQLDTWAYLNTIADDKPKRKLHEILHTIPNWDTTRPLQVPYESCTVHSVDSSSRKVRNGSSLKSTIYNHIHTREIRAYWEKHNHINPLTRSSIDWETSARACELLPKARSKWFSKWVTGFCGVGKQLKAWKWQQHSNCPRCLAPDETVDHVLLCRQQSAMISWENSIGALQTWLIHSNCEPNMMEMICNSLSAWHDGCTIINRDQLGNDLIKKVAKEQERIGWHGMFNGFISSKWRQIQSLHFKNLQSTKSPILWMSRFQRRIWIIPWTQWEHRNLYLHQERKLLPTEIMALDSEITREWYQGLDSLSRSRHSHLFSGNLQQCIRDTTHFKQLWLANVWAARDSADRRLHNDPIRNRNSIAKALYIRWKERMEKN